MVISDTRSLRVLFVPDSIHWVTGTIAKSIARFNPWIDATIASGPVIDAVFSLQPELMRNFDLVHFICPYASRDWLPRFHNLIPSVTSHHHVTDWELVKHNLNGDAIVVGSPEWAEDLNTRGADMSRVFCVPYGVDAELFQPPTTSERESVRRKLRLASDEIVVGFFGKHSSNDDDRKGIDVFTRAAQLLGQRLPKLAILIIGPGWKELVTRLNADGVRCTWIPFISGLVGLAEMYRALDFYWVTARVEGGPVTLLEAMSSEVCCLTTSVGIAREIVRDGHNGVRLPFNDPTSFAERTLSLANDNDERRRLSSNARQTILEEMHVGVMATRVVDVYAKAFEHFSSTRNTVAPLNVHEMATRVNGRDGKQESVPLHGFPREIHRRVKMIESLSWSEHLVLYHQQRRAALRMIFGAWLANPRSSMPPRVLLRRFLPLSVVDRLIKLKNRQAEPIASPSR